MAVEIYYFSGTGNCRAVAKAISEKIDCAAISIADLVDSPSICTNAETIGVVFPTYLAPLHGVPLVVDTFIRKIENLGTKCLFAVCSCGGYEMVNAVPTLKNLATLAGSLGGKLCAAYSVRLPMNNLDYDHIPVPIERDSEAIIRKSRAAIEDISHRIATRKAGRYHVLRSLVTLMMTPMYAALRKPCLASLRQLAKEPVASGLGFRELMPLTDRSIRLDDTCNGCAMCARVCPVHNIHMIDNHPAWQHRCEMCLACDEWCPQNAVHHWGRAHGVTYHHPDVRAKDMIVTSRGRADSAMNGARRHRGARWRAGGGPHVR